MVTTHDRKQHFWQQLRHPRSQLLITSAVGLLTMQLWLAGQVLSGLTALMALSYLYPTLLLNFFDRFDRICHKHRLNPTAVMAFLAGMSLIGLAFFGHVEPASAQFFSKTEGWLQSNLKLDASLNSIVFNVLRGVFVLYLAINLVKVVQAARDGEDWQTLARTPLIILVTVTMGDTLASAITGAK